MPSTRTPSFHHNNINGLNPISEYLTHFDSFFFTGICFDQVAFIKVYHEREIINKLCKNFKFLLSYFLFINRNLKQLVTIWIWINQKTIGTRDNRIQEHQSNQTKSTIIRSINILQMTDTCISINLIYFIIFDISLLNGNELNISDLIVDIFFILS